MTVINETRQGTIPGQASPDDVIVYRLGSLFRAKYTLNNKGSVVAPNSDASVVIQAAINAVFENGGSVFIKQRPDDAAYLCNSEITLPIPGAANFIAKPFFIRSNGATLKTNAAMTSLFSGDWSGTANRQPVVIDGLNFDDQGNLCTDYIVKWTDIKRLCGMRNCIIRTAAGGQGLYWLRCWQNFLDNVLVYGACDNGAYLDTCNSLTGTLRVENSGTSGADITIVSQTGGQMYLEAQNGSTGITLEGVRGCRITAYVEETASDMVIIDDNAATVKSSGNDITALLANTAAVNGIHIKVGIQNIIGGSWSLPTSGVNVLADASTDINILGAYAITGVSTTITDNGTNLRKWTLEVP